MPQDHLITKTAVIHSQPANPTNSHNYNRGEFIETTDGEQKKAPVHRLKALA